MFCSKCGKENEDAAAYCNGCGNPLQNSTVVKTSEKTLNVFARLRAGSVLSLIGAGLGVVLVVIGLLFPRTFDAAPTGRIIHLCLFLIIAAASVLVLAKKDKKLSKILSLLSIVAVFCTIFFWIVYGLAGFLSFDPGTMCLYSPFLTIAELITIVGCIKTTTAAFAYAED